MIQLSGGPLDGYTVDASMFRDGEAVITTRPQSPPLLQFSAAVAPLPPTREAVYRITDDENQTASFAFWNDERPPSPLAEAMGNATDDEILKLMDDVERLRRR